jgi:acyl-CoA hydrolase
MHSLRRFSSKEFARFDSVYRRRSFQTISTIQDAVASINPGDNVFVHTAMMSPVALLDELVQQRSRFIGGKPVQLYHLHTEGRAEYLKFPSEFHSTAFFCGANDRACVNSGHASFIPVFLSEVNAQVLLVFVKVNFFLVQGFRVVEEGTHQAGRGSSFCVSS